jgi:hypothetical protein
MKSVVERTHRRSSAVTAATVPGAVIAYTVLHGYHRPDGG